jgi:hypothetical protein
MSGPLRLIAAISVAACGGSTSLPIDARCNPLGVTACLAPWPSSAFEVDDPATATGRRLAIPEDALPRGITDTAVDPARWNTLDGFSATSSIVIAFPGGVSDVGLPASDNMDLSMAIDSPTVILDMTTGERVAHHVELDEATADSQALLLRPAGRLTPGHRYAIAITTRVVASDGGELPTPPGFRALRDDRRTDHGLLEAMRPRFDGVLDALDAAGIPDDELVIAWDFTVASDASAHADLIAARERALTTLASYPTLFRVAVDQRDGLGRRVITGTLDGPLFLSNGGDSRHGTRLVRDDAGLPAVQGLYRIPFVASVPACVTARAPVPMVIWGHTAFGDAAEVGSDAVRALADGLCVVIVGTDLRGRSRADLPAVQRAIEDLGRADEIDTLVQGLVDHVTLALAMRTVFADQLFRHGTRSLVDPARVYYAGENVALAALLDVERAAIVQPRRDQRALLSPMIARAYEPIEAQLVTQLIEARWDRVLPARFDRPVLVLSHGDHEAASWLARSFVLPVIEPSPSTPWGVKTVKSPPNRGGVVLSRSPDLTPLRTLFAR